MTAHFPTLSLAQMNAIAQVKAWLDGDTSSQRVFRLFGCAGTDKSMLAKHIAALVDHQVIYAAFTGKAVSVMEQNGCEGARTLHSLIYKPISGADGRVTWRPKDSADIFDAKLIIVDEVSMIDDSLAADLLRLGLPVLALGDPAQLPPVGKHGVFASAAPDVMLEEVHRQIAGNPVLQLATAVRAGIRPTLGAYGSSRVMMWDQLTEVELLAADQIIVGTNDTRHDFNENLRSLRGVTGDLPVNGDRIICLRNHERLGIFNGETFRVVSTPVVKKDDVTFEIVAEIGSRPAFEVTISAEQFISGSEPMTYARNAKPIFDFAYAITCHRAQGSQWRNVLIIDQSHIAGENAHRWLYTAITRAQEQVTIVL